MEPLPLRFITRYRRPLGDFQGRRDHGAAAGRHAPGQLAAHRHQNHPCKNIKTFQPVSVIIFPSSRCVLPGQFLAVAHEGSGKPVPLPDKEGRIGEEVGKWISEPQGFEQNIAAEDRAVQYIGVPFSMVLISLV
jgi:hypothetical protein